MFAVVENSLNQNDLVSSTKGELRNPSRSK